MLRPSLVHENSDVRVITDDRARDTGVVEVHVRQQDLAHVGPPDAMRL
jgi:hypothetical protein